MDVELTERQQRLLIEYVPHMRIWNDLEWTDTARIGMLNWLVTGRADATHPAASLPTRKKVLIPGEDF